ncbi:hypothetical protein ACFWWM_00290 [Streptomyces sp. NPDC058682]|uniref:hypothetical protein n=1 Tax=Streptomyces sp. NPDC058682 TaxID=3346596 RepID=UPI003667F69F
MSLRFIAKDPNTDGANCPTAWADAEKEEVLLQGWLPDEATLAECRKSGPIPEGEGVIRIPIRMAAIIKEAFDAASGTAVQ